MDGQGWFRSQITDTEYIEIEEFSVNGEMAPVRWFRQGDREFNGKYVVEVIYAEDDNPKTDELTF